MGGEKKVLLLKNISTLISPPGHTPDNSRQGAACSHKYLSIAGSAGGTLWTPEQLFKETF